MRRLFALSFLFATLLSSPLALAAEVTAPAPITRGGDTPRLFFVGERGSVRLNGALPLSNGELLLVGAADDFAWAGPAPRTRLSLPSGAPGGGGDRSTPFILHLSSDLASIKALYALPSGTLSEISRIRSTEIPGQTTGSLFISGRFTGTIGPNDAYWIARLDGNAVTSPLKAVAWLHTVKAPGRVHPKTGVPHAGDYAERQPWDVRADGQVVFAEGEPYSHNWCALRVLSPDGKPGVMPAWLDEGGGPMLPLRAGRKGSLRSTTQADFDLRQEDENGNPGRKGRHPDDYYFTGPDSDRGPGYTGYRVGQHAAQRVSSLAIDRRDNALYFGTSTQSRLPDGKPDFEPAFIALNPDGSLRWWARGYLEIERTPGDRANQDGQNSPPDQYVDHVAIDYAHDRLLVLARCHGNGVINFWSGNSAAFRTGRPGAQIGFSGGKSDIHISWLAAYGLADGKLHASTFVAEMAEGTGKGEPLAEGPLVGWPSPNSGFDLTTTLTHDLAIDHHGRPALLGLGRRPFTTAGALMENVKPRDGISQRAPFARVYDADLGAFAYSTILRSRWDPTTPADTDDRTVLSQILPLADGVLVLGRHARGAGGKPPGIPARAAPAWGGENLNPSATEVGLVAFIPLAPPPPPPEPVVIQRPQRRR